MNETSALQVNLGVAGNDIDRRNERPSWFEVMASSWGQALDQQANRITDRAAELNSGNDTPFVITMLTAESLRMQFLASSSHTSITSMSTALESMARKT